MGNTTDFTKRWNDLLGGFLDGSSFAKAFQDQAAASEQAARIVTDSAEAMTDLAARQVLETLARLREATRAQAEPAGYFNAMSSFVSQQAEGTSAVATAYLDVLRKMQAGGAGLLTDAGTSAMAKTGKSAMEPTVQKPVGKAAA